ncbi:MAG: extracellular solute-binding protein [Firmicutes bacterium]|nr:extracellular solute-binding protein [Bacillota bacterium]
MKAGMTRCLVTALLVCAMLGSAGAAKATVTFLVWGDTVRWQPILAGFAEKHPGLEVEMQSFGGNAASLQEALFVRTAAGTPPDLALTHLQTHAENVEYGLYADLTPFVERDRVDLYRFFPKGGVDAFLSNGRVTGIPSQLSTHLLWYNKTLLDADGMPYPSRDWRMTEELVVNARKLTRDIDGDGIIDQWGFGSVNMYTMAPLFWGTMMWTDDLRHSNLLNPKVREAYEWVHEIYHTRQIASPQRGEETAFKNGKLAMMGGIQAMFGRFSGLSWDWDVEVWPIAPAGPVTYGSAAGISMARGASHPEEAWTFLKYWMQPAVQEMAMTQGLSPAGLGALRDYFLKFDARAAHLDFTPDSFQNRRAILESFERTVVQPNPPGFADIQKLRNEHLIKIVTGESSPQVVLETLHPLLEAMLQEVWSRRR